MAPRQSVPSCRFGTAWKKFKLGGTTRSLRKYAKSATNTRSFAPTPSRALRNSCALLRNFRGRQARWPRRTSASQDQQHSKSVRPMRAEAFENKETGLASAHGGRVVAGGRVVEVARVRITEAGVCTENLIRIDCVT